MFNFLENFLIEEHILHLFLLFFSRIFIVCIINLAYNSLVRQSEERTGKKDQGKQEQRTKIPRKKSYFCFLRFTK